jgi:hypothetical protein
MRDVKAIMRAMEMTAPKRPRFPNGERLDPELPSSLTSLNDVQLGDLYGQFAAMARWAQLQAAVRSREAAMKLREDRMVRAEARLRHDRSPAMTAHIELDPQVKQVAYDLLVAESVAALTQAVFEGYLVARDALSRELTRRTGLEVRNNRL